MTRFRAVTFDVTGTLLRFRLPPGEYYAKVGTQFGVHIDPRTANKQFMKEWKRMNIEHPNFGLRSGMGWEKWWHQIVRQTFLNSSVQSYPETTLTDIYSHLMNTYQTPDCWRVQVGALELLEQLSSVPVPMGVISNNDERLDNILRVMGLRRYFDFVLTSYNAGFVKPDPRIFEKAFTMFDVKGLKPGEVIHVGDKVDLDYLGAEGVGWVGSLVHVKNKESIMTKYPQLDGDRLFPTLKDLAKYVVEKNGTNGDFR